MDCRNAKENIDLFIDGVLSSAQTEELYVHADVCLECKQELENAVRLKRALAALGRMEAPKGLAKSAMHKAKKPRKAIPFAYISAAAAAVIALVIFLASGTLPGANSGSADSSTENRMMAAPAEGAPEDEGYMMDAMPEAPAAEEPAAPAAPEEATAADGEMQFFLAEDQTSTVNEQGVPKISASNTEVVPTCFVYVPEALDADIRDALQSLIIEYGLEYVDDDVTNSILIIVTQDVEERLSELTADLDTEGIIQEGQAIQFLFNQ